MYLQNEGTAALSACRTLIGKLPDVSSPDRSLKEDVAIDTCAVSFVGESQECQTFR
jgi:hypothetical protein